MSTSPLKVEENSTMVIEKKGLVTILGSDLQLNKVVSSLRRTLSADMSSTKWLARNGMKKIASSQELSIPARVVDHHSSSSSDGEDELDQKPTNPNVSWSSILLAEKTNVDSNNNVPPPPPPPPYVHPLTKKPATLNEKSLEICTESLGSETGSDGFSSYPQSETSDVEEAADKEENAQQQQHESDPPQVESTEEFRVAKYNHNQKVLPKAFPPPLPSIARGDRSSLHMQSHRKNGRLVLEAVSVPQINYFHSERQEGRLRLSLASNCQEEETEEDEVEELEQVFDNIEEVGKNDTDVDAEEEDEEEEAVEDEEEIAFVMEQSSISPSYVINLHNSGVMMKRLMRVDNNNPTWSNKLNEAVNFVDDLTPLTVARVIPLSSSLPTTTTTSASFNVYEYFWRKQPNAANIIDPITQQFTPLKDNKVVLTKGNEQRDLVVLRRCKDRTYLLTRDPRCIATP